jgi:ribosomal protein L40E
MVSPRIREVQDKQEMQRVVDDFMTQGYTVKEEGTESILLKKKTWGSAAGIIVSLILMVIVGVFTVFIGFLFSWLIPVIYVIYAHYNAPEVLLRIVNVQPQVQAQPQAPLRQTPPPPQARPPQAQTSTAGKICSSCNSTNDASSTYCSKCGARI